MRSFLPEAYSPLFSPPAYAAPCSWGQGHVGASSAEDYQGGPRAGGPGDCKSLVF